MLVVGMTENAKPLGRKKRGAFLWLASTLAVGLLSGCTVVSVTTSVVGLAADAAIGTVKIVGKGVGKAADAMLGDDEQDDGSGITIRYRDPSATAAPVQPAAETASSAAPSTYGP